MGAFMKVCLRKVYRNYLIFSIISFISVVSVVYGKTLLNPQKIVLTTVNHTALTGEVNNESINKVLFDISISDSKKPFYIFLNTPGGNVFSGRTLIDYLRHNNRKIQCIANTAISMGFHIFEDGCKRRLVMEGSFLMTHQISSVIAGNLNKLDKEVSLIHKMENFFDLLASGRMHLTLKQYQDKLNPEFWMIGSEEILDNNAADELVDVVCDVRLENSNTCPLGKPGL